MELTKTVKVVRLQTSAAYVFAADNQRAMRPFLPDIGAALAKELEANDFSVQPGDQPLWFARQGVVSFSEKRRLIVSRVAGGPHELSVTVEGSSADALDVLNECWSKIGELDGQEDCRLTDFPGNFSNATLAIVELPIPATTLIPALGVLEDSVRAAFGSTLMRPEGSLFFRLTLSVPFSVRGVAAERSIIIEPRFTSIAEDQTYFTVSPLTSDAHLAMLEKLAASVVIAQPSAAVLSSQG